MSALNLVDYIHPTLSSTLSTPNESLLMECGRLIHAAVISKRFLTTLLANPIQSIEAGFCGEKFSFTQEEKQHIQQIQASSLAEFSSLLIQTMVHSGKVAPVADMAFAQVEACPKLSA